MNTILILILNLSIIGGVTGVFVIVVKRLFNNKIKKSTIKILWIIVLSRLIIPLSIPLPIMNTNILTYDNISKYADKDNNGKNTVTKELQDKYSENIKDNKATNNIAIPIEEKTKIVHNDIVSNENKESNPVYRLIKNRKIYVNIFCIWCIVAITILSYGVIVSIITLMKTKQSDIIDNKEINIYKRNVRVKKNIKLLSNNNFDTPFVFGVLKPNIIIPSKLLMEKSNVNKYIIIHELYHIRGYDNLIKLIAYLVLCIHWFNPIIWVCFIMIQLDIENACDEKVIDLLGDESKIEYADLLYEYAVYNSMLPGAGFANIGMKGTKMRIKNILNYKKRTLSVMLLAILLIAGVMTSFAISPMNKEENKIDMKKGEFTAFINSEGLNIVDIKNSDTELIIKNRNIATPKILQEGKSIAYLDIKDKKNKILYVYDLVNKEEILSLEGITSYCVGKGKIYAASKDKGLVEMIIDEKNSDISILLPSEKNIEYYNLLLSPDGKKLAFNKEIIASEKMPNSDLYILNTVTNEKKLVFESIEQGTNNYELGASASPAKWFPDSNKLVIWQYPMSASTNADGMTSAIYDVESDEIKIIEEVLLGYEDNIIINKSNQFLMVAGSNRVMEDNKRMMLFELNNKLSSSELEIGGLLPAYPDYSIDGKEIVFAGLEKKAKAEDVWSKDAYKNRKIYKYSDNKVMKLTDNDDYTDEYPRYVNKGEQIIFIRIHNESDEISIWIIDNNGKNLRKICDCNEGYDDMHMNKFVFRFYGYNKWNDMMDIY